MTPDQIMGAMTWRPNNLFREATGEVSSEEFIAQVMKQRSEGGLHFQPVRWFCADEDLIHSGGDTWAFSNQWGGRTEEAIRLLLDAFPSKDIKIKVSTSTE